MFFSFLKRGRKEIKTCEIKRKKALRHFSCGNNGV